MKRPQPSEYYEYYGTYINRVPEGNILQILEQENKATARLLGGIAEEHAGYRYAPDKWSIKEVVGHLIDTERVFGYRALSIARADPAELPSMEQDDWAMASNADKRTLPELTLEFVAARQSHVALFESFDSEMWGRRGIASGYEFTVRTFPYILAGHEIHHRKVLIERYGI